jgi:hypothetical protein
VNVIRGRASLFVRTILFAGLVTEMACPAWGEPYDPTLMPYRGHGYGRCYPFVSCAAYRQSQILEQRREQAEELRRRQQPAASVGVQTGGGFAITPSDEAEIQPSYIESGQIRDEYQESGEMLPEFRDGRVRPLR